MTTTARVLNPVPLVVLSDDEISSLLEAGAGVRISLIMPVQQETDKRSENRIRLKNLLQAVEEEMASLSLLRSDIEQLLAPVTPLVQGGRFLATEYPGLAIYLDQDFSRAYQLPYRPQALVTAGPYFQIKQLMPLRRPEQFYILVLSQQGVRLLRASQYTVARVDLQGMPQSLAEALRWDDPERELQWHSGTGVENGGRAAMFHGHGVGSKEQHKEDLLRYFQLLDQGLSQQLVGAEAPLILAGVDYLLPIYREASSYAHVVDEALTGNSEHYSDADIQRQAWPLVRPEFQRQKTAAVARYQQLLGQEMASADLATILPAAAQGRVETLFVAMAEQLWGEFNPENGQLERHDQRHAGDVDLLNVATIHTVLNGGVVSAGRREETPGEKPLAAIFRYSWQPGSAEEPGL